MSAAPRSLTAARQPRLRQPFQPRRALLAVRAPKPRFLTTPAATMNYLHPYDENANAQNDIDAAIALAKVDHKNVLLSLAATGALTVWC